MDERIGFGLYQSCENKGGGVGRVCLFLGCGGVGGEVLGTRPGRVGWCYMSV